MSLRLIPNSRVRLLLLATGVSYFPYNILSVGIILWAGVGGVHFSVGPLTVVRRRTSFDWRHLLIPRPPRKLWRLCQRGFVAPERAVAVLDQEIAVTLPPVVQEEFIERNKLVRPTIIRESTNQPNIKYLISLEDGSGTLLEKAATLVRTCWPRRDIFDHAKDKIIIYCRTRLEVRGLQELLGCPAYMSESGSEEEKRVIINGWLGDVEQPAIVATSALGIGFDYPHVRWVIHVDAPDKMTDFSQESGRAGPRSIGGSEPY